MGLRRIKESKKAINMLSKVLVFLLLNVIFILFLFLFVYYFTSASDIYEKLYARSIALKIDALKDGSTLVIITPKLFEVAEKNKYNGEIFGLYYVNSNITITLSSKGGHSFHFFRILESGSVSFDNLNKTITVKT